MANDISTDTSTDTTSTTAPDGAVAVPDAAPEAEETPKAEETPSGEAARYRTKLRETEAERDQLAEQLAGMRRTEAERLASTALSKGGDVWLDGADVGDLLDGDGHVDPEKVAAAAASVLDGRPGLAVPVKRPKPDLSQGVRGTASHGSDWQAALRGTARG
jgi:hypothetical protein